MVALFKLLNCRFHLLLIGGELMFAYGAPPEQPTHTAMFPGSKAAKICASALATKMLQNGKGDPSVPLSINQKRLSR
jgi:hypothetical protein